MCKKRCFAQKNQYFKSVLDSRMRNLEETQKDSFITDMINWFEYYLNSKKATGKRIFVRIHTSGDFYSYEYLRKWKELTDYFKNNNKILFQAYTKSMPILNQWLNEGNNIKDINIHFVWSIWKDTTKEYTEKAKELGLQTFTALPKQEIENKKNVFICKGDCGNCKQCYTGTAKEIIIPIH
jgi:hypothetical protein